MRFYESDAHIEVLICSRIIPIVSKLRDILPFSLNTHFCRGFIESTGVGDGEIVDLTCLTQSDGMFDCLKFKCAFPH